MKKQSSKKPALPLTRGHKIAMSECDCESSRDFKFIGFDTVKGFESSSGTASIVERSKKESFSVSKIWLRGKQEKPQALADSSSRRDVSLRFSAGQKIQCGFSGKSTLFCKKNSALAYWKQNQVVHSSFASNL
ncbi:hypothetical protein K1719_027577 [Acacia pycnantha]|nr:hypothetical protein K1719_027577 [Acacia pycnantha]